MIRELLRQSDAPAELIGLHVAIENISIIPRAVFAYISLRLSKLCKGGTWPVKALAARFLQALEITILGQD
jgi:hypothetical protein